MINNKLYKKAIYFIGSLLVFVSYFFTANTYANDSTDIEKLEAFYYQVFNTKPSTKTKLAPPITTLKAKTKTTKSKKVINQIPSPSKQKNIEAKDPELVAFYEMVFEKPVEDVDAPKVWQTNTEPKHLETRGHDAIQNTSITNRSNELETSQPSINDQTKPTSVKSQQLTLNNKSQNEDDQEKGVLDDKLLYSQTKKTDTASLFEKAFGKKKQKNASTPISNNSSKNSNDMASLFAKAFGKKTAIEVPSKVKVDFRVSAEIIGEIELFSNSSGNFDQINTADLLELLKEVLKEHVFIRVKEQLVKIPKTKLISLNTLGISTFYNSTNLSLDVDIKPELRKPQILSLINKKKASVREENKIEAEKISGYLNAFTNVGLSSGGDEADLKMRLEGSLNINGFVFETTSDYRSKEFDLGRTTLTYDKPEKLQRFAIGNISTGNRNFQENLELDGIRISKEFFLDPDLQISPRANEPLHLDTDSEVELYINNQLIRRFYLKAGVYALQDIGLYNGANNIRIRIKDEFGKVTVRKSQQYYDSHLLKPGLSLFAISVGYLSNQQSNSNNSLEKKPIFSGYYQRGISEELTLSLDAQLSSENYLLGAETISSIPIGSLRNSVAISGGKDRKSGYAANFEFRPNQKQEQISLDTLRQDLLGLDTRSRGFINNWSITGEYRSEDFSNLNGIDQEVTDTSQSIDGVTFGNHVFNSNKLKGNLQTNISLNISDKWQGSLNLGVADYYDEDESYYTNLSATRRFNNGVHLSIGSRYDTDDEFSMNLQLSVPLSRKRGKNKVDLDVLADSRDNAYETKLNIKPTSLVGKNSLSGSLEHFANQDSKQQLIDIRYRDNLFEGKLTARNRTTNGSSKSNQQLNLGFNTALACVGGNCAASYPINDSFALVSGPSNQSKPIALSNNNIRFRYSDGNDTGLPDNYSALIPSKGKKAVVRLESYRTQNINIDEGTLPNGYDSEKTEFSMFAKYRQGFLVKAGGEPATTLDGMLIDENNKFLGFKGGQWIPENEGKTVAFFSNKGGRFRVTSIPAGRYKLELFDYPEMEPISINVPDTKGKTHDLGNLTIKTPN